MRAGMLRNRIEIQAQASVTDAGGTTRTGAWSTVGYSWAHIINAGASEIVEGKQVVAQRTTLFRCRKPGFDINETMRVLHGGKTYNINSIEGHNVPELVDIKATLRDNQ